MTKALLPGEHADGVNVPKITLFLRVRRNYVEDLQDAGQSRRQGFKGT